MRTEYVMFLPLRTLCSYSYSKSRFSNFRTSFFYVSQISWYEVRKIKVKIEYKYLKLHVSNNQNLFYLFSNTFTALLICIR